MRAAYVFSGPEHRGSGSTTSEAARLSEADVRCSRDTAYSSSCCPTVKPSGTACAAFVTGYEGEPLASA